MNRKFYFDFEVFCYVYIVFEYVYVDNEYVMVVCIIMDGVLVKIWLGGWKCEKFDEL